MKMKLNAPTKPVWVISLVLGVLSLLAYFVAIPFVSVYLFWFMAVAWLVLVLATRLKGL